MIKIYTTRQSKKYVYIFLEADGDDEYFFGVKKMKIDSFDYAKKFHNKQLLNAASIPTTVEKDEDDAMEAVEFTDKDVLYSCYDIFD